MTSIEVKNGQTYNIETLPLKQFLLHNRCTFRIWGGGWQAVSLEDGVTVMEKREILVGWVTKECLKCTKKLEVGRVGDI